MQGLIWGFNLCTTLAVRISKFSRMQFERSFRTQCWEGVRVLHKLLMDSNGFAVLNVSQRWPVPLADWQLCGGIRYFLRHHQEERTPCPQLPPPPYSICPLKLTGTKSPGAILVFWDPGLAIINSASGKIR